MMTNSMMSTFGLLMFALMLLSPSSSSAVHRVAPHHATPAKQTDLQKAIVTRLAAAAEKNSAAATPAVIQFLNLSATKSVLKDCCSDIIEADVIEDPVRMLNLLRDGIQSSELVHNFFSQVQVQSQNGSTQDVNITVANDYDYFLNEWEMMEIGFFNTTGGIGSPEDSAETGIFELPEFTGANATPDSWDEAVNRLVYVAMNYQRVDIGNELFGDVSVVFSKKYAKSTVLMSPFDSGIFEMNCNQSWKKNKSAHHFHMPIPTNCSAWEGPGGLSTLDHFDHMFLPAWNFWNQTDAQSNLASMCLRMFGKWGTPTQKAVSHDDILRYWEPNIVGTVTYPDGVQFVVAHFSSIFGTDAGLKLKAWCIKWGWPLVWSLGTPIQPERHGPTSLASFHDQRRIDPAVLYQPNITVANKTAIVNNDDLNQFNTMWNTINASRTPSTTGDQWVTWWHQLPSALQVQPVSATSCADRDGCFAITLAKSDCVCRS